METGSKEEVVVKAIKELVKSLTKSVKSAEWSLENGILYHRGKIYVPDSDLCCHISGLCEVFTLPHLFRRDSGQNSRLQLEFPESGWYFFGCNCPYAELFWVN